MFVAKTLVVINIAFAVHVTACELEHAAVESHVQTRIQIKGDRVRLDCNISLDAIWSVWQRRTVRGVKTLFAGLIPIKSKDINHIEISTNYSLVLSNITTDDNGVYICKQCGLTLASYDLKVITVIPELRIQYGGINVTNTIFVEEGTRLQLNCIVFGAVIDPIIVWHVQNTTLSEHTGAINKSINEFVEGTFDFSKTLTYLIEDDTEMICSSLGYISSNVSVTVLRKLVDTAVLPELRIQYEGRNVTAAIVANKGSRLQLDCVVFRAIDEPSIVWQVKNATLTEQPVETMRTSNHFVEGTFDFRKSYFHLIERDTEVICSSLGNRTTNVSIIISTVTTEIPVVNELRVQHGGKNVTDTLVVDKGTILQIDCVVYGATEEPVITWHFKNTSLTVETGETQNSSNLFVVGTFDFRKTLTYLVEDDTTLICSSLGNRSINVSVKISSSLLDSKGKSAEYETDLAFVYVAAIAVCVFFVVSLAGICAYVKMCRGASQSKAMHTTRSSIRESSPQHPELLEPDIALESRLIELQDVEGKVTRTLPKAPNLENSYARSINEEDLYSEVSYNLPSGGVYSRKRICFISKLSDGVICERWMGNLTATDGEKKYVFISCVKDVVRGKHCQWDVLVKTLLELPESAYIFRVEGICLDEPRLYLLQGYITCEPLIEHISMKANGDKAWKDHPDLLVQGLTDFSLQVTSGMEFVMTHGLSHPGLSVKKILITEDGICKLYDFCLAEDALQFMEWLKLEADFSSSSHPFECVEKNDYTSASDVWYTGFAVREIFSYGSLQCSVESSLTQDNRPIYSLPSEFCPPSVNECLKECLKNNCDERVTNVKELLDALKSGADTARIRPKTAESSQSDTSPYVPMDMDCLQVSLPDTIQSEKPTL